MIQKVDYFNKNLNYGVFIQKTNDFYDTNTKAKTKNHKSPKKTKRLA